MKIYLIIAVCYLLYNIISKTNKTFYVLVACCYMAGAEVFFRMTKAMPLYEMGKYSIILFCVVGIFYQGFKVKAFPYLLYLLLLLPGVLLALNYYSYDLFIFRKNILFNLSGPICLTFSALYFYSKEVRFKELQEALNYVVYPLISATIYITLYAPSLENINTVASNSALSGGFGPNQVSTVLGLGVFILFTRFLIPYKNKIIHIVMMILLVAMIYRALLTFSRGGVLTAAIMAMLFTVTLYFTLSIRTKAKVTLKLIGTIGITIGIWLFAVLGTGGLLENRYSNKNSLGQTKEDVTTGRVDLFMAEIQAFLDNPLFGGGVGASKVYHDEEIGVEAASHNEVSRIIGEHGLLGILAMLILLITPLINRASGSRNIYFLPFMLFWFLTILHSSMRIAAPGFIYGLSLLNLDYSNGKKKSKKETIIPREQTIQTR